MSKCKKCQKSGIFFKTNESGLCKECERIKNLQIEEEKLIKNIEGLKSGYNENEKSYIEMKEKRDELYHEISEKAKHDAIEQIVGEINKNTEELNKVKKELEENENLRSNLNLENEQIQNKLKSSANKLNKLQTIFKSMQYSVKKYFDETEFSKNIITDNISNEAEEMLGTIVNLKLHLMDVRELRKLYNQNNKIIQELLVKYQNRYTTKANVTIYKLMVIALEAELQNVLYNIKYSKLDKAIEDIKLITAKYFKISTDGNQNIATTMAKFIGEIEYLFIEAIKIEYEYYVQKERIKEEQRAIREQMRQEQEEKKLLEQQRKQVEKEEEKYKKEIENLKELMNLTNDELKIKQFEEQIIKIEVQLDEVEIKKDDIIKLQNGKAGYIYIISNLGSFGENMFKVGMTRRLDPQDRVNELGDASVPFPFDVHSFIFSNNAPELETSLHKKLNEKRVNKVNLRKEFFNTNIDELENMVYDLEPTAEFNRTMLAEQYYQSLSITDVPDEVKIVDESLEDE